MHFCLQTLIFFNIFFAADHCVLCQVIINNVCVPHDKRTKVWLADVFLFFRCVHWYFLSAQHLLSLREVVFFSPVEEKLISVLVMLTNESKFL